MWLFVALLLAALARPVMAEDTVNLISYTDYAPYVSDKVPGGGMLTEVVSAAFAAAGTELQVTYMPWKRGYRMVLEGEAVGTFSWQKTEERTRRFTMSDALFSDSNLVYTTLPNFSVLADLEVDKQHPNPITICIPHGWTLPGRFRSFVANGTLRRITPEKVGSCVDLMYNRRTHIINVPPLTMYYELRALAEKVGVKTVPIQGLRVINPGALPPATTHILFAKTPAGNQAAQIFKKGFDTIKSNGLYREIITKHLKLYPGIDHTQIFADLEFSGLIPATP